MSVKIFKQHHSIVLGVTSAMILILTAAFTRAQQPSTADLSTTRPAYTIHTGARLVIEDVTVTGGDGKPVHGLKQQDFLLTEDGEVQRIRSFGEHQNGENTAAVRVSAAGLPPGIFTNFTQRAKGGPANVLLLDMLNTPLRDQQYARREIQKFLDHAPAGTEIAIFGLTSRLVLLQGFTSDFSVLRAALSRRNSTGSSQMLEDTLGGGGSGNTSATGVSDALSEVSTSPDTKALIANAQQFEADSQSFQLGLRTVYTLDALNELARYLSNIPGRKNLIWFSGSFPVNLLPNTSTDNGFSSMVSHEAEFHETIDLLASGQIALYPVDARGLQTTGTFNAASQSTKYGRDATALGKDIAQFNAQTASENSSMLAAANETGGRAFLNTNDLSEAVSEAVEDGSNFYTLTYTPTTTTKTGDDSFRKIRVSVRGKSYTLHYRQGYFVDAPGNGVPAAAENTPAANAEKAARNSPITRAMMHGTPVPTQIEFTVQVRPATGRNEATVAEGNQLAAKQEAPGPPFLRLAVDYAIDQRRLNFQNVEGKFRGNFEFISFVYDANGTLLNRVGSTLHADFTPQVYAEFLRRPFTFNQDISVPNSPALYLRIAVHDLDSDQIGAIEMPVDTVRKLPPVEVGGK